MLTLSRQLGVPISPLPLPTFDIVNQDTLQSVRAGWIYFMYGQAANYAWRIGRVFPFNQGVTLRVQSGALDFDIDPSEPFPDSKLYAGMAINGLANLLTRQRGIPNPSLYSVTRQLFNDKTTQKTQLTLSVKPTPPDAPAALDGQLLTNMPQPPPEIAQTDNTIGTGKPMDSRAIMLVFSLMLTKLPWQYAFTEPIRSHIKRGERITTATEANKAYMQIEMLDVDYFDDLTFDQIGLALTHIPLILANREYYGSFTSEWTVTRGQTAQLPYMRVTVGPTDDPAILEQVTPNLPASPFDDLALDAGLTSTLPVANTAVA